jgi:hypothetical protein
VGPLHVVVDPPVLYEHLGFEQGIEAIAVEQLVTQATVEALDPGVLPRAARIDEHGVRADPKPGHVHFEQALHGALAHWDIHS